MTQDIDTESGEIPDLQDEENQNEINQLANEFDPNDESFHVPELPDLFHVAKEDGNRQFKEDRDVFADKSTFPRRRHAHELTQAHQADACTMPVVLSIPSAKIPTSAILDILADVQIESFLPKFCQHTGKPCGIIGQDEMQELVTVHGIERAKIVLQYMQKAYAPEWMLQDENGLNALCLHDPIGYFIFTASLLLQSDFAEKRKAWELLQTMDENVLRTVNEFCRRILAKCHPAQLKVWRMSLGTITLSAICKSATSISTFQFDLKNVLEKLISHNTALQDAAVHGFGAFNLQSMSKPLTELEKELAREFNDFELIPDSGKKQIINLFGKTALQEQKKAIAQIGKEQKRADKAESQFGKSKKIEIVPTAGFKLNLFGNKGDAK